MASVLPFTTQLRLLFCLNVAWLHLFLTGQYKAIDYKKFEANLKFKPKNFHFKSEVTSTDENKPYFTIKSDARLNTTVSFNLPKKLFLERFHIPLLENSAKALNE